MNDQLGWMRGRLHAKRLGSPTVILGIGLAITLLLLLANRPGAAIILASLILPIIVAVELPRRDVFENEPRWGSPALVLWGLAVGLLIAALDAWITGNYWIDLAILHVGAAGFGGEAASAAGSPPIGLLLLSGVLLTALAAAGCVAGAIGARRFPEFRNEAMDGVTLGAAAGGGFATGTTIVYLLPLLSDRRTPVASVADWTSTLIGLLVTRPLIYGMAISMICAGVWLVALSQSSRDLLLPVGFGLGGLLLFATVDLIVEPLGTRWELLWHLVATGLLAAAFTVVFRHAHDHDVRVATGDGSRVVCPQCRAITPIGQFCAHCGATIGPSPSTSPPADDEAAATVAGDAARSEQAVGQER